MMPAPVFWGVTFGGLYFLVMWWLRTQRLTQQRQATRALYTVSEQIVAARTAEEIAARLAEAVPALLESSTAELYVLDRTAKTLDRVSTPQQPEVDLVDLSEPGAGLGNALAASFRNRTLLTIPDTRNNPLIAGKNDSDVPRALLIVPLVSHEECIGAITIGRAERTGPFAAEHQAAAQHLANQVASALKLQEQSTLQQQLFRGEKLAATGQMISGIAGELRAPLTDISRLSQELLDLLQRRDDIPRVEGGMRQMAGEAARAQEIVKRLTALGRPDNTAPRELDITAVLQKMARFRAAVWQEQGIEMQLRFESGPLRVLGAESQLEQVFLTLIMQAEAEASRTHSRSGSIKTSDVGGTARIEIGSAVAPGADAARDSRQGPDAGPSALSLMVCQGIVETHGGEWREHRRNGFFSIEVILPCVSKTADKVAPRPAASSQRSMTVMLVDADPTDSRPLLKLLNERGHRVVPASAEEAPDLAPKIRFDAVFWNTRPGRSSGDFLERVRASVGSYVVIGDGYNQDLASSLEQNGGFLLARPVEEPSLDRILGEIGSRPR